MMGHPVLRVVAILSLLVASGCYFGSNINKKTNECETLAKAFDDNAPFLFAVAKLEYHELLVGGKLVKVSEPYYFVPEDKEQNKITYALTFKGMEKEEEVYLRAHANKPFSYAVGIFYKINLSDIRPSGRLSGSFFDFDMNKLQAISCS